MKSTVSENSSLVQKLGILKQDHAIAISEKEKYIQNLTSLSESESKKASAMMGNLSSQLKVEKLNVASVDENLRRANCLIKESNQANVQIEKELQVVKKEKDDIITKRRKDISIWISSVERALSAIKRIRDPVNRMQEIIPQTINEYKGYKKSSAKLIENARKSSKYLKEKHLVMHNDYKDLMTRNSNMQKELEARKQDIEGATKVAHSAVMQQNMLLQSLETEKRKLDATSKDRENIQEAFDGAKLELQQSKKEQELLQAALLKMEQGLKGAAKTIPMHTSNGNESSLIAKNPVGISRDAEDSIVIQTEKGEHPISRPQKKQRTSSPSEEATAANHAENEANEMETLTPFSRRASRLVVQPNKKTNVKSSRRPRMARQNIKSILNSRTKCDDEDDIFEEDL